MRTTFFILAAVALLAAPRAAHAGYTATTGERVPTLTPTLPPYTTPTGKGDLILTPDTVPNGHADVGEIISTPVTDAGDFTSYTPDTFLDPQITGNDLALYHYLLNGSVASVTPSAGGDIVKYTGTYRVFYDNNKNDTFDLGDNNVSLGDFTINATYDPALTGGANLVGLLTQNVGPDNAKFRNLGLEPVNVTGSYTPEVRGQTGRVFLTLRSNAVIPEPSSLALLSGALVPLAAFRRRRK